MFQKLYANSGQLNFPSKEEPANFKDNILDKVCEKLK